MTIGEFAARPSAATTSTSDRPRTTPPAPPSGTQSCASSSRAGKIGCHPECGQKAIDHRAIKEDRVRTGRAHAALVLDEDGAAQGWCQYGSPEELPGIKHRREYEKDAPPRPDWRVTCFYVDKKHRGRGIARAALEGALDQLVTAEAWQTPERPRPAAAGRRVSHVSSVA